MKYSLRLLCTLLATVASSYGASNVTISEIMYNPAGTKAEWIEVTNLSSNRIDMAQWRLSGGANLTLPDFSAASPAEHFLLERERILFSSKNPADTRADYPSIPPSARIYGPWTGALDNSGETVFIRDKNEARMCEFTYGDGGRKWPAAPDGTGHSLVMVSENRTLDDWHNWRTSPKQGGTPGTPDVVPSEEPVNDPTAALPGSFTEVIPMGATWDFYKELAAPPVNWNSLAFVPAPPWGSGPALLGFETAALPAPGLRTTVQNGALLSYYFRKTFTWTGGAGGAQFQIDAILDDGATYYINGTYIGNKDSSPAPVHNSTLATATITEAALVPNAVTGPIPAGVLVEGTNVLAAVCLQVNNTSTDMIFGSNLRLSNLPPASVQINEIRQAPAGTGYIEFYNPGGTAVDLNGYYLTDTQGAWTKYPISQSVNVPPGGLATIGFAESGFSPTAATTTLFVARPDGSPMIGIIASLPQDGRSLGRKPVGSGSWYRFSQPTPGQPNSSTATSSGTAVYPALNEVHFNSTNGNADWVEFANTGSSPLPVAGLFVASLKDFSDKVALTGTITANGFISVDVDFPTDNSGDLTLFLLDSGNNVVGEAELDRRPGKPSSQAWPVGSSEWYATTTATRDAANVPDRVSSIVMSEIMYAPPSDHSSGEFIELYNRGAAPQNVGGWIFDSGISYTIPAGTTIAPGERLVVAQNAAFITASYPGITGVIGNYGGVLSNGGELIRLLDAGGNLADEVDYHTGGDWPRTADSLGSSLELINPMMDNDSASSWAASNETQKGEWTSFTHTGTYYGVGPLITPEIHFNLVGDGHIVVRNMAYGVQGQGPASLTTAISPTNSGVDGWRVTGTHWATFSDAEGLHIVADGAGDMKGNAIEFDVPQVANTIYTMSFQARWVTGLSRLVLDSQDHTWGRTFAVPVPNNLGTPGAANSRAAAAAAPEIWSMLHSPPVPRATDDVRITARVSSSLPLASVSAIHRLDSVAGTNAWATSPMNDTGTAGDVTAGDGIYTATVTNYKSEGAIVQFYIEAAATGGGTTKYPAGSPATPGLWIVDSSPVSSDLLVQRFVMSEYDRNSIGQAGVSAAYNYRHPRMSNHYYNATLIINEKDITYNIEARKSGSPWTRDGGNGMDRVRVKYPKDRMFRGREKTGDDNDPNTDVNRRWNNDVSRYWLYLLGYPAAEAEFVHVQFNNLGLTLKEDTEPTDTDMLDRTYENSSDSELHEIDDAWYFGDDLPSENRSQVDGNWIFDGRYLENPVYWHGSWPIRTRAEQYDFSPLTSWIRTMYNNGQVPSNDSAADATYRASVENLFDVDKFARYAAVKGWAGAWDNFTINRGKNGFVYRRPTDGRWEFHFWDGDLDFQNTGEAVLGGIGGTQPFFSRPWFRRQLNYYLQEIRDKWSMNSPRMYAWLQAKEDQSPSYNINQDYYKSWFTNRRGTIDGFIVNGGGNQTAGITATASVGASTTQHFTSLNGTASSLILAVAVDGHPEGVFRWLSATAWQITGISLKMGANALTVRGYDRLGAEVGNTVVNVTKTVDAPPVLTMVIDPASMNAAVGEAVVVDSTGSFDPEGTPLNLTWTVTPATGVTNTPVGATGRRLVFTVPGIYTVTLSATDGAGTPATLVREITAFAGTDFDSFGNGVVLGPGLTAANVELRDNYSPAAWYSLEDVSGRLHLQITETGAMPIDSGNFPHITRPLPASADWVMQTDAHLETRHLGEYFNAGLMLDMTENGQPVRYIYSLETGDQVRVRRDDSATAFYTGGTAGAPSPIRINAGGPQETETDARVWQADNYYLATPPTDIVTQVFAPVVGGASGNYGIIGDTRRSGVSSGGLIYEIPVDVWPGNYNVTLYSATVAASQTISMNVNVNDAATSLTWGANSSTNSIMRLLAIPNVPRNANGKIKVNITRNASTTAGAEVGICGIEITPIIQVGGALPAITPAPVPADGLRIQRSGNSLIFSRLAAGVWVVDQTIPVAAGSTAVKGGIFASTETPQNLRVSFDYLLVADPSQAAPILSSLRLTELMYHPTDDGVEYIEFQNTGAAPINLSGVNFPATTPFAAFSFGNEVLAPGEFIVLTGDPVAFRTKYGPLPRLAATSWASGSLDNAGEHIVINDTAANALHDFIYDDAAPWPVTPDGTGPSLEVIDVNGDYNNPLNWRASASPSGTPGGTVPLTDPDTDGDGISDSIEAAFGLPANSPGQLPAATAAVAGGQVTITWPFAAGRNYRVERSTNLAAWTTAAASVTGGSFSEPINATAEPRLYYRVMALP